MSQITRTANNEPIFFLRVPAPGFRNVDTDPPDGSPQDSASKASSRVSASTLLQPIVQNIFGGVFGNSPGRPGTVNNTTTTTTKEFINIGSSNNNINSGINKNSNSNNVGGYDTSNSVKIPNWTQRQPLSTAAGSHHNHDVVGGSSERYSCARQQLKRLGFLEPDPETRRYRNDYCAETDSVFVENFGELGPHLARFTHGVLLAYLVNASRVLNVTHTRSLKMFILSAFDMARELLITPRKLEFAKDKEDELYKSLMKISVSKLDEIKGLIAGTISMIRSCLVAEAGDFEFVGE